MLGFVEEINRLDKVRLGSYTSGNSIFPVKTYNIKRGHQHDLFNNPVTVFSFYVVNYLPGTGGLF
jgi:hypothetical protein